MMSRLLLQKVNHPDEALPDEMNDDLVVMATQDDDNLICPLTRATLEAPVKKYTTLPTGPSSSSFLKSKWC